MRTGAGALATLERVMRVGVLIPATLACAAVADLALRALPHDRFSFRAWEAVRTPGEDAPFLPNTRYHNDRTYGNLSAIGNIPAARRYRSVTLTTDRKSTRLNSSHLVISYAVFCLKKKKKRNIKKEENENNRTHV